MQYIGAYQPRDKLKHSLKNPRPAAYDIGDDVANGIADVLAAAITSEDAAEKVADTTYYAADGIAYGVNNCAAQVLQNLYDDVDQFLDELADFNEDIFDYGHDNLDELDYWLKY